MVENSYTNKSIKLKEYIILQSRLVAYFNKISPAAVRCEKRLAFKCLFDKLVPQAAQRRARQHGFSEANVSRHDFLPLDQPAVARGTRDATAEHLLNELYELKLRKESMQTRTCDNVRVRDYEDLKIVSVKVLENEWKQ